MAAKLVVTAREGGSRIALVGASGKELLASAVFTEPRAKGATLRSLKGMLGDDIVVEDHTLAAPRGRGAAAATNGTSAKRVAKAARRPAGSRRSRAAAGSTSSTPATKAAKTTKARKSATKS